MRTARFNGHLQRGEGCPGERYPGCVYPGVCVCVCVSVCVQGVMCLQGLCVSRGVSGDAWPWGVWGVSRSCVVDTPWPKGRHTTPPDPEEDTPR